MTQGIETSGVVPLDEFSVIAAAGSRRVINLLPGDDQHTQADKAETVERLGMDYVHIPIDIERPTITDYEQFERAMDGASDHPVWVH